MKYLRARVYKSTDRVAWGDLDENDDRPEGLTITFETGDTTRTPYTTSDVLYMLAEQLDREMKLLETQWLYSGLHTWIFNLDALKENYRELASLQWLSGLAALEALPIMESPSSGGYHKAEVVFTLLPKVVREKRISSLHDASRDQASHNPIQSVRSATPSTQLATIEDLIFATNKLEETASKIQSGNEIGLSSGEIASLVDEYEIWFADALALLPDASKPEFQAEYKGGAVSPKIRAFLEGSTKVSVLHVNAQAQGNPEAANLFPYWQYPFDTTFRSPLRAQRRILRTASRQASPLPTNSNYIGVVEHLARRFPLVARQLQYRHDSRTTIKIEDEYDVQDSFHALLHLHFDDVRSEEWTPSYAGASSRVDFLLKSEQIVVEVKKTRPTLKKKELREQLIQDIAAYPEHKDCKTLLIFVYDPDHFVDNPKGFETDLSKEYNGMVVKVFIVQ